MRRLKSGSAICSSLTLAYRMGAFGGPDIWFALAAGNGHHLIDGSCFENPKGAVVAGPSMAAPGQFRLLPRDITVVTAASTADLLVPFRFRRVIEMGWGETCRFDTRHGALTITAFRVQHWGARVRHDVHRGFNGYVLSREGRRICLTG